MNISIVDPGWDWAPLWITLCVVGGLLLIATVVTVLEYNDFFYDDTSWVWIFPFMAAFFMGAFWVGMGGSYAYEAQVEDRIVAELEDLGFEKVEMFDTESFTASLDGAYFDGALISTGDLEWQVAEIKTVE